MANEQSGKKAGSIAGKKLADPNTPKSVKTLAASVLTQRPNKPKK